MYGVILAGGKGTRFWPYSRAEKPKQFLDITGEGSMLSLTWKRLSEFIPPERMIVLTIESLVPLVRKELPRLRADHIFIEPVGRNTAPSIAVAAALVRRFGGDEPFLTCPADHTIANERRFRRIVRAGAAVAAKHDVLVTFGVVPSFPATGYGYIEAGTRIRNEGRGPGIPGEEIPRKARREAGGRISQGAAVLLEQRHLPLAALGLSRGVGALSPRRDGAARGDRALARNAGASGESSSGSIPGCPRYPSTTGFSRRRRTWS